MKKNSCIVPILALLAGGCATQITRETTLPTTQRTAVVRKEGDTTSYVVEFATRKERKAFAKDFEEFLSEYTFDTLRADTIRQYLKLRLVPGPDTARPCEETMPMATVERPQFEEADVAVERDTGEEALVAPQRGGSLTLYSERGFLDNTLAKLISAWPFGLPADSSSGTQEGYLKVEQVSPKRLRITLNGSVVNGEGQRLTAFDLVEAWTSLVKTHPAEGAALFRSVRGLGAFVRGEEAVIAGVQIRDEKTIVLNLADEDDKAVLRLQTPRLLPASLKLGPYYVKKADKNAWTLAPNASYRGDKALLDGLTLAFGGDDNALVSYSLKRYDMITLTFTKDIEYAERSLTKGSKLGGYSTDRYFLALASPSPELRRYISQVLTVRGFVSGMAKVEALPIAAIESDEAAVESAQAPPAPGSAPALSTPLTIIYQSADPLSVRIAEKVLAHLSQHGLSCRLKGLMVGPYGRALYDRDYDCAVGWVPKEVLESENEQLRLATMWFEGSTNEARRISEGQEIALFAVKRRVLCKKHVGFLHGKLAGIYVRAPTTSK